MKRRIVSRWLGLLAVGAVAGPALAAGSKAGTELPKDFRLVAEFGSGEGDWHSWKTTIEASGQSVQAVFSGQPPAKKPSQLPLEAVRGLYAAVRAARFFEIPQNYEVKSTDLTTLVLTVTAGGRKHSVRVYGFGELKPDPGLSRFLEVWREVLRQAPSPNRNETPEFYRMRR